MSIILGIDPGSRLTGWGVVCANPTRANSKANGPTHLGSGVIEVSDKKPLSERLGVLLEELDKVVREFKPSCFSIEKVFFGKNASSAFVLGQARGVAMAVAGKHHLPVHEYATRSAKKMLTGSGAASKDQVQLIVQRMLNIRESRLDATDALALAVCHASHEEIAQLLSSQNARQKLKGVEL